MKKRGDLGKKLVGQVVFDLRVKVCWLHVCDIANSPCCIWLSALKNAQNSTPEIKKPELSTFFRNWVKTWWKGHVDLRVKVCWLHVRDIANSPCCIWLSALKNVHNSTPEIKKPELSTFFRKFALLHEHFEGPTEYRQTS